MSEHELERKLARALEATAPDDIDSVLSRCEARKGTVIELKKKNTWKGLIAACLALCLIGGGSFVYARNYAVASVVSLDVNPSIELTVNRDEKVLSCTGLNEDGKNVLADMAGGADLKGTKLNVAVNAVVGALVSHGYLEDISSALLISVEDKDDTRAARLRQELTGWVDSALQLSAAQASVLSQTVASDKTLSAQAEQNQISTGKAQLVNLVLQNNPGLTDDTATRSWLSALGIEPLRDLSERTDLTRLPLDPEEIHVLALEYAGLADAVPLHFTIDPEFDEPRVHYEVEFRHNGKEYEYILDAFTGEVLSGKANVLGEVQSDFIISSRARQIAINDFISRYPELSGYDFATSNHLDRDDSTAHYEIKFYVDGCETEYEIDAVSGAILSFETDYVTPVQSPAQSETPAQSATTGDIGRDAALAAALKHAGLTEAQVGRIHVECDYEDDHHSHNHHRLEYEVEFHCDGYEYEYTIDGATGAVLEHEKDWDD